MNFEKITKPPRRWLSALTARLGILLCRFGRHKYAGKPILASLDTYWMQGGEECLRCHARRISFAEAGMLANFAYERGKQRSETKFLAYGNGVNDVVALYGKAHVQRMLDEMPNDKIEQPPNGGEGVKL